MAGVYTVEDLAVKWGCAREKIAWLIANRQLRAFTIGVGKRPNPSHWRILPKEIEGKEGLALVDVPAEELAAFTPKPPRPQPVLSPLAQSIRDAIRAHRGDGRFIYFVRCARFLKVGQTKGHPRYRVQTLWWGMPFDLELMKVLRGSLAAEAAVHKLLSAYHHRHEWFRLEPDLEAAVRELPSVYKGREFGMNSDRDRRLRRGAAGRRN
jgi:hypothetical protein